MSTMSVPVGSYVHYWRGERRGSPLTGWTQTQVYDLGDRSFVWVMSKTDFEVASEVEPINTWVGHPDRTCGNHATSEYGSYCEKCEEQCARRAPCDGCETGFEAERLTPPMERYARQVMRQITALHKDVVFINSMAKRTASLHRMEIERINKAAARTCELLDEQRNRAERYGLAYRSARRRAGEKEQERRTALALARLHAGARERDQAALERVRKVYEKWCDRTANGCSDDFEECLADLGLALYPELADGGESDG